MTNNDIRKALKDKFVADDKKASNKADKKEGNEEPSETLRKLAIDFENFYNKVVGTEFKATHEVDLNTLHRVFEKYVSENPFEKK